MVLSPRVSDQPRVALAPVGTAATVAAVFHAFLSVLLGCSHPGAGLKPGAVGSHPQGSLWLQVTAE